MLPNLMPALLTPFDGQGRLDPSRYPDYIAFLEEAGVDGHFAFGTTGEGLTLSPEERREGLEALLRVAKRPVVAHVGSMNFSTTQDLLRHAVSVGAAAAAVVSPGYYTHDADGLLQYYLGLAATAEVPLLMYNIPSHSQSDVTPAVARRIIGETSAYVGIKDSSKNPNRLQLYRDLGLMTYVGAESLVLMSTLVGGGSITAMAAAFPELVVRCRNEAREPGGVTAQRRLTETHSRITGPSVQSYREILRLRGIDLGPARLPFRPLRPAEETACAQALQYSQAADA